MTKISGMGKNTAAHWSAHRKRAFRRARRRAEERKSLEVRTTVAGGTGLKTSG